MLKTRIVTALAGAAITIWAVFTLTNAGFALFLALLLVPAGWEWSRLSGVPDPATGWFYGLMVAAVAGLLWWLEGQFVPASLVLGLGLLFWASALFRVCRYRGIRKTGTADPIDLVGGAMALLPCWLGLVVLHRQAGDGPWLVMLLLALVWAADTGAYFAGRRWGHSKLLVVVSPGKTREGFYGGLAAAALVALVAATTLPLGGSQILPFMLLCVLTAAISVLGDLFESMLKRQRGIKDSSRLLPGHGGVLDRIDSITAASPLFALGVPWLIR